MQRVTITLDDDLLEALDGHMRSGGHSNRSEAIRDLVRTGLEQRDAGRPTNKPCVAALVYVYDHETRRLAEKLTSRQHEHHDMSVATMHVHLDAHECMEVAVLRGAAADVRHFADHLVGERGVRYGQLVTIPASEEETGRDRVSLAPHRHRHSAG